MESSFTAHHQTWCNNVQHRRDRHRHSHNSIKFVKDIPCEHKQNTKTRAPAAFYCTFVNATKYALGALGSQKLYDVLRIGNRMGVLQSRGHTMENLGFLYISDFPQHVFSKVPPLWKKASCSGGETEGLRVRKAWVWTPLSSDLSLYPYLPLRAWGCTKFMLTRQLPGWPRTTVSSASWCKHPCSSKTDFKR